MQHFGGKTKIEKFTELHERRTERELKDETV